MYIKVYTKRENRIYIKVCTKREKAKQKNAYKGMHKKERRIKDMHIKMHIGVHKSKRK